MTALNMWTDAEAAYILNDTAILGDDFRLIGFSAKTAAVNGPYVAVAVTGRLLPGWIIEPIAKICALHPADIINALPQMVRKFDRDMRRHFPQTPDFSFGIGAAVYDPDVKRPLLFIIGNDNEVFPSPIEPFTVTQTRYWTTGNSAFGPFEPASSVHSLGSFDPQRDGLAMMEQQRRDPFDNGHYCIGGEAILTRVAADGVTSGILGRWEDDRIGEFIRPLRTAGM